ncbi:MAG TPA: hypothetical protein VKU40_11595 [Thermoanaerobaculia bacterium]|nr:hypothetical protein [Thermoanaerobaculia bacterium]
MKRALWVLAALALVAVATAPRPTEPLLAEAGEGTVYYVNRNAQKSGDHEVHTKDCKQGAQEQNRLYLGRFENCRDAVRAAKKHYRQSDGCHYCARACDTG